MTENGCLKEKDWEMLVDTMAEVAHGRGNIVHLLTFNVPRRADLDRLCCSNTLHQIHKAAVNTSMLRSSCLVIQCFAKGQVSGV